MGDIRLQLCRSDVVVAEAEVPTPLPHCSGWVGAGQCEGECFGEGLRDFSSFFNSIIL